MAVLAALASAAMLTTVAPGARAQQDAGTPAPDTSTPDASTPGGATTAPQSALSDDRRTAAVAALDDTLDRHASTFGVQTVGVAVLDADGDVLVARDGDRPLLPASTMKLLTAMTVTDHLDPDRGITTAVQAPAPVDGRGRVPALWLVGAGDPTLTTQAYRTHVYPARPATSVEDLADAVVAAGVKRVTGDVVGDATGFGPARLAAGWPQRYLDQYDARHIAALTIDTGLAVDVARSGGLERLEAQVQTPDPALLATWRFTRALQSRGVRVDGRVRTSVLPAGGAGAGARIASVESPRVGELLRFMLEESDNHLADTLVRTAAMQAEGTGSWSAGDRTMRAALEARGIPSDGVVADDGSGLSRLDRVTALALAGADRAMTAEFGDRWTNWLSTASRDGTFRRRLVGTTGEARFHGKSGTLDDVRAAVGHVTGPTEATLHLAIVANDLAPGSGWRTSLLLDDLVLTLADVLDGCVRTPREGGGASGSASPRPSASATPTEPPVPLHDESVWERTCAAS